jgi:hypothetical protein
VFIDDFQDIFDVYWENKGLPERYCNGINTLHAVYTMTACAFSLEAKMNKQTIYFLESDIFIVFAESFDELFSLCHPRLYSIIFSIENQQAVLVIPLKEPAIL